MSRLKPIISVLLTAVAVTSLTSCWRVTDPDPATPPETLAEARRLWQSNDLDDYRFDFERVCFCAPTKLSATVYVRADTVYRFENLRGDDEPIDAESYNVDRSYFVTVEDVFERIEAAASEEQRREITYDADLGYPRDADVGDFAVDAGVSYTIRNLESAED